MYVSDEGSRPSLPNVPEKPPNEPKADAAARLLEACDLNFLLMWGMRSVGWWGEDSIANETGPKRRRKHKRSFLEDSGVGVCLT